MKCLNLSRDMVENLDTLNKYLTSEELSNSVFICINDPSDKKTKLPIEVDKNNRLDLFFFDSTNPINPFTGAKKRIPEPKDAAKIIDFILKHEGKNIIQHCTAGVSRSGAISDFLVINLGYDCPTIHWAHPNVLLLELLDKTYKRRIDKNKK